MMTLIEGIGDEVTQVFGALLLVLLGLVSWWSTGTRELPPIRTVVIFERRAQSGGGASRQPLATNQWERNANDTSPNRNLEADEGRETVGTKSSNPLEESECATREEETAQPIELNEAESAEAEVTTEPELDVDNIRIRLKYLNDEQRLVQGKLNEPLGDFKRRHFSLELSREKRVRLIFNGQVLQSDEQTLQRCGLYDNCVVHCLVHQQMIVNRPSSQQQMAHGTPSTADWNLGGVLYLSLSLILGFAWFLKYNYSQLFTLTTTTSLTGFTAMYIVSIISMYLPDVEAPPPAA